MGATRVQEFGEVIVENQACDQGAESKHSEDGGPVFIIGCPRSGTSALSWAVAQHPNFWTSAESDFMHHLFGKQKISSAYRQAYDRPDRGWLCKNEVSYEEFCGHLGVGIDQLFRSRSGGLRWVDATPGHTLMAEDISMLFPTARFLHIVRDGRAVVCSMLKSGFGFDWASDFGTACFTWAHFVKRGLEFESGNSAARVLHVRHEDLVESPEEMMDRVQFFLGDTPHAGCGEFLKTRRINSSYDNAKPEDIRKTKDTGRLRERPWESWSVSEKAKFRSSAGAVMDQLGISLD